MTLLSPKMLTQISINEKLVMQILQELIRLGVKEVCVCSGKRNAPFVTALHRTQCFKQYFWPEERSAAFFALGRSRLTHRPTVIMTTSGTAAAELLPAAMEAYYTGVPLILLTADRPRSYRGTNAPQTAEQVGLFGQYAVFEQDLADEEECSLHEWLKNGPAHLNVCLDEPLSQTFEHVPALLDEERPFQKKQSSIEKVEQELHHFLKQSRFPFFVVSAIPAAAREPIAQFLLKCNAPTYLEGVSGLREDPRLSHLRIVRTDGILQAAQRADYPIDTVLRIGGVPTFRFWRDLEVFSDQIKVFSINHQPFSGLSGGKIGCVPLDLFFKYYQPKQSFHEAHQRWLSMDQQYVQNLNLLLKEEPLSEAALFHQLSDKMEIKSLVYLGNSLPIREWDSYAVSKDRQLNVQATRGLSGIEGQLSTFFGLSTPQSQNWGIFGDLTTIYDMAGPWILQQMQEIDLNVVVINNGGGKIFASMFPLKQFQNPHHVKFNFLADLWHMHYEHYTQLPEKIPYGGHRLIEIVPNEEATRRFWDRIVKI